MGASVADIGRVIAGESRGPLLAAERLGLDGGVAGLADHLLAYCVAHQCELHLQADGWRACGPGGEWAELTRPPLGKSAFRGLLARLAALLAEQTPGAATPYGGQGELRLSGPAAGVCRVWFANTPADQQARLTPVSARPTP